MSWTSSCTNENVVYNGHVSEPMILEHTAHSADGKVTITSYLVLFSKKKISCVIILDLVLVQELCESFSLFSSSFGTRLVRLIGNRTICRLPAGTGTITGKCLLMLGRSLED